MSNTGVNQPQHKVGDIVNGHILTAQNEWKPVAPAPAAPVATPPKKPKRKWFLRKRVLIPVGLLAFIIIVSNLNGSPEADDAASVDGAVAAAEEPAAEPVAEEAPAPETGTATNPVPQPYVAKGVLGGEKYSLTARVSADAPDVTQWNMFNDPAPAGFKWVVVELTMTGIDKDGVEPSLATFDLTLSTPEGNQYNEDAGLVLGDGMPKMYEGPTLYPGSAFTGNMTFLVPEASTGLMLHDNGNYIAL